MIPIRIRQFPSFVRQMIQRHRILSYPKSRRSKFYLCYFSCQSYFRYLYCSLHSLVTYLGGVHYEVIIFNDSDMPMSEAQKNAASQLIPGIRIIDWPKSMGWGNEQISNIWRAYAEAALSANENDFVVRVDSDVFFFNDTIFQAAERSDADLIGDGHFVDFEYAQGGCYLFRVNAIYRINEMIEKESIERLTQEIEIVVEDIAATHFARRLDLKIWLTWFMMFPDELYTAGGLTTWQRFKFSCIHFVMKNKNAMLETYINETLKTEQEKSFRKIIATE